MDELRKPLRILDYILAALALILGIVFITQGSIAVGVFVAYLAIDKFASDKILYNLLDKYGFKKIMGNEDILDDGQ